MHCNKFSHEAHLPFGVARHTVAGAVSKFVTTTIAYALSKRVRIFVKWHRHSHCSGVAGALGREYDDDLYQYPESRYRRNRQPVELLGLALAAWLNDGSGASS